MLSNGHVFDNVVTEATQRLCLSFRIQMGGDHDAFTAAYQVWTKLLDG
jgi:hypothetical protein